MSRDLEAVRKSTLATLGEIVSGERNVIEQHGMVATDPDEWQQLKDIVARIERRLMAKMPESV